MTNELRAAVEPVVDLLERGDFSRLAQYADPRVLPEHLEQAVHDHGATLTQLTDREYDKARVVQVSPEVAPDTWAVWIPVRTLEEGTSDLKLQLVVHRKADGDYVVKVDGIVVT